MNRTHRTLAPTAAAGLALALGAGVLGMAPAQAETATHSAAPASAPAQKPTAQKPTAHGPYALVRSATERTVYYLKTQTPQGGEAPAADGTYAVDITSGSHHEHFTVTAKGGRLDLSRSSILKTARVDPQVSVHWIR